MTLMEFSIFPVDKGASVSTYVARCLDIIDSSGLPYRLHAMGTVVEGELPQLLDILQQCFAALQTDCDRITCTVKFDHRNGSESRLETKLASLEAKVGRRLRT
ncbi:MAG: MTH1187 family thiamine-binding protein [Planctomycetota bacterium]